jgi:outer membrane protein assembly factor BamD (BamD/ComL family)
MRCLVPVLVLLIAGVTARAQSQFTLDPSGQWVEQPGPPAGTDEAVVAEARRLLAEGRPGAAIDLLKPWIKEHAHTDHELLPRAYLTRGDAWVADGDEYEALYDYEYVCQQFPGTPEFVTAVERELEIAIRYADGLKHKRWGMRLASSLREGIELLMRVQERMPGSSLAERALIELADHYYKRRKLELASECYEIFLKNFPRSAHRKEAMLRHVITNIAQFNGAKYDATGLLEARALIADFQSAYPVEAQQVGLDDSLVSRVDEALAAQMLDRARSYERRRDPASSRYTLRRLITRYPTSAAAEKATELMGERGWTMTDAEEPTDATSPSPVEGP